MVLELLIYYQEPETTILYTNPTFAASSACFKTDYEAMHRIFETPITTCDNTFTPSTCTYFVDTDNDDIVIL